MEKSLFDIEKQYCIDVTKFFCDQYGIQFKQKENADERRTSIQSLITNQIENRLYHTNLIKDYKVDVLVFPLSEKREIRIDNVLEDKDEDTTDRITICLEFRDCSMTAIEFFI
jgi:hypothetical protein